MARPRRRHPAVAGIDEAALAEFRAGIRRRYTDEQILEQLHASAERLGRSPTMREFAADPGAEVHPQTVIEHFGTWNAAKRAAGLMPRRFISREELLEQLRRLAEELGRTPTARDLDSNRRRYRVEVTHLAHVRLAQRGAARGGLRRSRRRREARARSRTGRGAREKARPPPADGRLERRHGAPIRPCCRSGRSTGSSTSRPVRGRPSSSSSGSACARRASACGPTAPSSACERRDADY